jgi:DNA-binding response OmpR family regulator
MVSATAKMVETLLETQQAVRRERARARFYELIARRRAGARALIDPRGRVVAAHPEGWLHGPLLSAGAQHWLAPGSSLILDSEPFGDGFSLLGRGGGTQRAARPELTLRALDHHRLTATLDGVQVALSPRRSQLLALLALAPQGRHGAELASALYGPGDHEVALRAELSRLRRQLGGVIATNPYRLSASVHADPVLLARVATSVQR